jgi:hypothetical protein
LVRNGASSGGFGTGPTAGGAFPAEGAAAADADADVDAGLEGGGEPLLDPMGRERETLAEASRLRGGAAGRVERRREATGEKTRTNGEGILVWVRTTLILFAFRIKKEIFVESSGYLFPFFLFSL